MARRLAAVLAADVVGFSAMMARAENDTLTRLIAFRKTIFDPSIRAHNGRIVKLMGDGALVEFASVIDAVNAAITIQMAVAQDPDSPIRLRIGINLGDIIHTGGDIYGDGVNVAARLEALANPGGICLAASVHQSIGTRIEARFADGGTQTLKNIETPVQIYHWQPDTVPLSATQSDGGTTAGKASIAVLAFDNMSTDPEQEYFSDGIAEDIITALSHFRDFFVIARNTSFTYKGQAIRVDKVCADLGVRYLLEGSVRKSGTKVRVTAQLIDGQSGAHIWAAKYDRELDDIFAVQDEITRAIVSAVAPETLGAETRRARHQGPESLSAWDMLLQARWHLGKFSREHNEAARALLHKARETDPEASDIHAALALCDLMAMLHVWRPDPQAVIGAARSAAETAVALDDQNANAHGMLGMALIFARQFQEGADHLDRAIGLNPNLAIGHGNFASYHGVSGNYEPARASALRAMELSPRDPLKAFWRGGMGIGAFVAKAYEDCLANAREGLREHPGYASLMRQEAAALGMLGRSDEARASVDRLLTVMPGLTIAQVRNMVPVRDPVDWERWLDGLRRAGLPEG
jgi:TolB-like protein/class 3 adenylate cyclase